MNIDELLKLPMGEPTIGGGPTPLSVLDRKEAKKQPMHNRIVLVDRFVEPAVQKIASLQNLANSGMKDENVLAISGLATLEILKNTSQQAALSKYLFLLPMGFTYKSLDQIVLAQLLFIVVFQQLYYMAILADTKDMPRFSESFEKRYTKLRQLISEQEVTKEIFSIRSDQLHTGFWRAVNDLLGIDHEYTFYEIVNLIIEKEPKELDAYFNSLTNPPPPVNINNDMSVARRGEPVSSGPSKVSPPPPPPPAGKGPTPSVLSASTGDPSGNNNNSLSTVPEFNENNFKSNLNQEPKPKPKVLNNAIMVVIKRTLYDNPRFYENFLIQSKPPKQNQLKLQYDLLKEFEKTHKDSYDAAIADYLAMMKAHQQQPRQRGGRYTLKNHRKINYAF